MYYIVFDLELNQDFSSPQNKYPNSASAPFEIIQIGAVKLDRDFNTVNTFDRYIKPVFYEKINPFITGLTGITTEQLKTEETFPEVYRQFTDFTGGTDSIFCVWGSSDVKELFRNAGNHGLSTRLLSKKYINIQPDTSLYFNFPVKNLLKLEHAVQALNIPIDYTFHNAFHDAYYTAEIFKKIYNSFIQPKIYDPSAVSDKPPRQPKKFIDIEGLVKQFEKMYGREITEEEKDIILLAFKMGKTGQFLK